MTCRLWELLRRDCLEHGRPLPLSAVRQTGGPRVICAVERLLSYHSAIPARNVNKIEQGPEYRHDVIGVRQPKERLEVHCRLNSRNERL